MLASINPPRPICCNIFTTAELFQTPRETSPYERPMLCLRCWRGAQSSDPSFLVDCPRRPAVHIAEICSVGNGLTRGRFLFTPSPHTWLLVLWQWTLVITAVTPAAIVATGHVRADAA